ncbi:phosphonoacetaldehyde dehydrogenase [Bradyrhizobium sp. CSA112]|nr:phosphonoacetaldehyde dehydrogenase [Bradyrhizobium sp. CSA112]
MLDSTRLYHPMKIAGEDVLADSTIDVRNPFTDQVIAAVPQARPEHVRRAFAIARVFRSRLTRRERARILFATAEAIEANRDRLAHLITSESGLCLKDSLHETARAQDVWSFAAQAVLQDDGAVYAGDIGGGAQSRRIFATRTPLLGVISAITPFNHPLNLVSHKLAPAIATNNRVVLKPAEATPLTALALAELLYEAGLPPEMLSVITGDPRSLGDAMINDPDIDLVTFTGSVSAGKKIAERVGYRRLVLELGGNDPLIVMDDADIDRAARLAVQGATRNSGQRCTAVKRALVVDDVADRFADATFSLMKRLRSGDPMDPNTDVGTVINARAASIIAGRVEAAIEGGARLLLGNTPEGALYRPTLLDHVPPDCELVREETFGPVLPIIRCPDDIEHIIAIANSTAFGLSAALCTNRLDYITRFVDALDVGCVNVWEVPGYRTELTPFGGIKDSGLGHKEGVLEAMKSFTNIKTYSLPW